MMNQESAVKASRQNNLYFSVRMTTLTPCASCLTQLFGNLYTYQPTRGYPKLLRTYRYTLYIISCFLELYLSLNRMTISVPWLILKYDRISTKSPTVIKKLLLTLTDNMVEVTKSCGCRYKSLLFLLKSFLSPRFSARENLSWGTYHVLQTFANSYWHHGREVNRKVHFSSLSLTSQLIHLSWEV